MTNIDADTHEIARTDTQAHKLTPPDGAGWCLFEVRPVVLPTPDGRIGIVTMCFWARPKAPRVPQ